MSRFDEINTIEDFATTLIEQEYCEGCHYNKNGICMFVEEKEETSMYLACYNAAVAWLTGESAIK